MPRFNIPQQRAPLQPAQADPQAFGAGVGEALTGIGQAVGDVAQVMIEKKERNEKLQLSLKMTEGLAGVESEIDGLKESYPTGEGYAEASKSVFQKYKTDFLNNAPEKYRLELENNLAKIEAGAMSKARSTQSALMGNSIKIGVADQIDRSSNAILSGNSNYAMEQLKLDTIISNAPAELQEALRSQYTDSLLAAKFNHSIQNHGYKKTLNDYNSGVYNDMDPGKANQLLSMARSSASVDIKKSVTTAMKDLSAGRQTLVDFDRNIEAALEIGDTNLANQLMNLQRVEGASYKYARAPSDARLAEVKQLERKAQTDGLTEYETMLLSAYDKHDAYKERMLSSGRHFEFYQDIDVIGDVEPLPLVPMGGKGLDQEALTQALDQRDVLNQQIINHDGDPVPVLSADEIEFVSEHVSEANPKQYSTYLSQLSTAIGAKRIQDVANLVAPKNENLAGDMALSMTRPDLVFKVKSGEGMPVSLKESDFQDAWTENGYMFSGLPPDVQSQAIQKAMALAAYNSRDEKFTKESIPKLFEEIIGKPVRLSNGTNTIQFLNSEGSKIPSGHIINSMNRIDDAVLEKMGVSPQYLGDVISAEQIREFTRIVPLNAFTFYLEDTVTGDYIGGPTGSRIEFNMEDVVSAVRAVNPAVVPEYRSIREGVGESP